VIALYDIKDMELIKQLSTLTMDKEGRIFDFIEKPQNPLSSLCATLIYMLHHETLPHIGEVIRL
jgi:dTDP-glucose pyrophosphorylase